MKALKIWLPAVVLVVCLTVLLLTSLHAVEEIHYLKGFYPESFSVEEAFLAARVELIKILLFAIPLLSIAAASLCLLRRFLPPYRSERNAPGRQ